MYIAEIEAKTYLPGPWYIIRRPLAVHYMGFVFSMWNVLATMIRIFLPLLFFLLPVIFSFTFFFFFQKGITFAEQPRTAILSYATAMDGLTALPLIITWGWGSFYADNDLWIPYFLRYRPAFI